MGVVLWLAGLVAVFFAAAWVYDRYFSEEGYVRAHYRAIQEDLEYHRTHPDCSLEEAHRRRDRVNRRYSR